MLLIWQEHQNFYKLFFAPFFRQHSPVPILTGFLKDHEPGCLEEKRPPQFSKTGGSPRPFMSDCGILV
jgi:hypothetical protein